MKKIDRTLLLVVILIFITGFSILNTNQLHSEIEQLQWQITNQKNSIVNQISGIENIVYQIKEADKWYQEVERPKLENERGEYRLTLKFKLTEYFKESKVSFHVKKFGSDEFITYDAADVGIGIFQIQMSEFGPLNPVSKFDVHISSNDLMSPLDFKDMDYENILEYYISVEADEEIKISETYELYMYELVYDIFQPISGQIIIDDENNLIETHLDSNMMDLYNVYYTINRVEIQAYQDNKMVEWWELEEMNTDSNWMQFVNTIEIESDFDSLYIEVKYIGHDENQHYINKSLIAIKR